MRLLLDEHLSPAIAAGLRKRGHDVIAISEQERWMGLDDPAVLMRAVAENRAIVTNNVRDFRPLCAERLARGQNHPGLVLLSGTFRRTKADGARIIDALHALLRDHVSDDALQDREIWL